MANPLTVVYSASTNLYPYLPATYMSLIEHNPECKVYLFIEDDQLPYEIPENCECVNVSGQKFFGKDCANRRTAYTYLSLMRACYTELFTGEKNNWGIRTLPKLDKVLQMDVDTIVRESLMPLWKTDMDGKWFFMTDETLGDYRPFGKDEPHYVNCGVCVFNLEQMRADGIGREAIIWLNENESRCIDQDCWNWLLKKYGWDKWIPMGARYNSTFVTGQSLRDAVVHYAGEKYWYRGFDMIYRGQFMEAYSKYFKIEECRAAGIKC